MTKNNLQKGFAMPFFIAILAFIAVAGGVYYFTAIKNDANEIPWVDGTPKMEETLRKEREIMEKDAVMENNDAMMEHDSMMKEYSQNVLAGKSAPLIGYNKADYDAAIKSDKLVFLYFYASWCPICKEETGNALYPAFNELTSDKVIGFRVNYKDSETDDDEKALAARLGISYQHTKVLLKNGKQILKAPDSWSKKRYLDEINKAVIQ